MNGEPLGFQTGYLIVKVGSGSAVHSRDFSMNSVHLGKVADGVLRVFKFDKCAVNSPCRPYELRVRVKDDSNRWEGYWVEVLDENW